MHIIQKSFSIVQLKIRMRSDFSLTNALVYVS